MDFVIEGRLRELDTSGSLAYLMPTGTAWRPVAYGQGEGEAEMLGAVWGFYFTSPSRLSIVLHEGEVDLSQAIGLVRAIAEKAFYPSHAIRLAASVGPSSTSKPKGAP